MENKTNIKNSYSLQTFKNLYIMDNLKIPNKQATLFAVCGQSNHLNPLRLGHIHPISDAGSTSPGIRCTYREIQF